jgi:hypothetical protein
MITECTNKVCFHTGGIINPLSWEIIGMSAKESDSAIGQFGSGLKFAIAILLRTGHQIEVITEQDHYKFSTVEREFRGKTFSIVTCNGKELGITTDMGKHWDLWMAYRELVSNTMDEGGLHYQGEPMAQGSNIVVTGDDFAKLMTKHEEYFVGDREPVSKNKRANVLNGNGLIFYRGVRVGEVSNAAYSYEINNYLTLTEDRTIKYDFAVKSEVAKTICEEIKDKKFLREIITLPLEKWEYDLDYDRDWSDEMSEVIKDVWENAPTTLNENIIRLVRSKMPSTGLETYPPNEEQQLMIDSANDFLSKAGYPVSAKIVMVNNEDTNNIAFVYDRIIHLTPKAFEKGLFFLTRAIFEEHCHTVGYMDESRSFENFLIEQVIIHAKRHLKIVL